MIYEDSHFTYLKKLPVRQAGQRHLPTSSRVCVQFFKISRSKIFPLRLVSNFNIFKRKSK